MNNKIKILVALSGGVDSSVAALLLKQQSYNVIGAYMELGSLDKVAIKSAEAVCKKLEIPFHIFDVSGKFKKEVVDYFIRSYESGITPNPCVVCNKTIKFGWLLDCAKNLGCDYLATGHYVKTRTNAEQDADLRGILLKAKDEKKDQSYFLWQLNQEQLKHILFPLGDLTKPEVRKMAKIYDLPTYNKSESQDICFVPDNDLKKFLQNFSKKLKKDGDIVDKKGNILGRHQGLVGFTIGQRENLPKLSLKNYYKKINPQRMPAMYVLKLDVDKNELIVGQKEDLLAKKLEAKNPNWISSNVKFPLKCEAKIRYGARPESCIVRRINDKLEVTFIKPQRAATPGQSIVFYKGEMLLGGGVIQK